MLEKKIKILSLSAIVVLAFTMIFFYGGINFSADADMDGVPDEIDAFDNDPTEWTDFDSDGIGDNADIDDDNDNVIDEIDAFDNDPTEWADFDSDGIGDNADPDDDNDGIVDEIDAFDNDPTEWADFDFDGIGSNQDTDDDNDGILDINDEIPLTSARVLVEKHLGQIEECALQSDGTLRLLCYGDFFRILVENNVEPKDGLMLAFSLSKVGALDDCHFASHIIGHEAFDKNNQVIENFNDQGTKICRGGFYHGVIQAYFNDHLESGAGIPDYNTLCDELNGSTNFQICLHGLGHGLKSYFGDDLSASINSCNELSYHQNGVCLGGLMMEYTDGELTQGTSLGDQVPKICSELMTDDLNYRICNLGLGNSITFHTDHNKDISTKYCETIGDEVGKEFCIKGIEMELRASELNKDLDILNAQNEKFYSITLKDDSKRGIVDILSLAEVTDFEYLEVVKMMKFSLDRPSYTVLYVAKELLPENPIVTFNSAVPKELEIKEAVDEYFQIIINTDDSGTVIISGI